MNKEIKTPLELVYRFDDGKMNISSTFNPQHAKNLVGIMVENIIFLPRVVCEASQLPQDCYPATEVEKEIILHRSTAWDATVSVLMGERIKFPTLGEVNGAIRFAHDNQLKPLGFTNTTTDPLSDDYWYMVCREAI